MLSLTDSWKSAYPNASVGLLQMRGVSNPEANADLDAKSAYVERALRESYSGADRAAIKAIPAINAYNDYYKRFKKTYHVQLQLESVLLKGRSIPGMRSLVKAMVTAELKNQLLTAGHDVSKLDGLLTASVATGDEEYVGFGGKPLQLKANDMNISDGAGVISSVLYGPDARTSLGPETESACFTVYAVPGIDKAAVEAHLHDIGEFVRLVAPNAAVELLEVFN